MSAMVCALLACVGVFALTGGAAAHEKTDQQMWQSDNGPQWPWESRKCVKVTAAVGHSYAFPVKVEVRYEGDSWVSYYPCVQNWNRDPGKIAVQWVLEKQSDSGVWATCQRSGWLTNGAELSDWSPSKAWQNGPCGRGMYRAWAYGSTTDAGLGGWTNATERHHLPE